MSNAKKDLGFLLQDLFPEDLENVTGGILGIRGYLDFKPQEFNPKGGSMPGGWEDQQRWDAAPADNFNDRFGAWSNDQSADAGSNDSHAQTDGANGSYAGGANGGYNAGGYNGANTGGYNGGNAGGYNGANTGGYNGGNGGGYDGGNGGYGGPEGYGG